MNITINLEALTPGDLMQMGIFLLALLTAMIAILDILKLTRFFRNTKTSPELMLICLFPIFVMPKMTALGNAISEFWGDMMPVAIFFFIYGSVLISARIRKVEAHNKSLNTDASDAGAG